MRVRRILYVMRKMPEQMTTTMEKGGDMSLRSTLKLTRQQ